MTTTSSASPYAARDPDRERIAKRATDETLNSVVFSMRRKRHNTICTLCAATAGTSLAVAALSFVFRDCFSLVDGAPDPLHVIAACLALAAVSGVIGVLFVLRYREMPSRGVIENDWKFAAVRSKLVDASLDVGTDFNWFIDIDRRNRTATIRYRIYAPSRHATDLSVGVLDGLASCFRGDPKLRADTIARDERYGKKYDSAIILDYSHGEERGE